MKVSLDSCQIFTTPCGCYVADSSSAFMELALSALPQFSYKEISRKPASLEAIRRGSEMLQMMSRFQFLQEFGA
jgi:hypothetical protein